MNKFFGDEDESGQEVGTWKFGDTTFTPGEMRRIPGFFVWESGWKGNEQVLWPTVGGIRGTYER